MSESTAYWSECPMEDVLATLEQSGTNLQQGWSPQCEREPAKDDEWGVLKTTSVQDGLFLEAENKRLPDTFVPKANIEVRAGDLLMTCAGPRSRCGVVCLVKRTRPKLMFSGKIYRFRPDTQVMDSSFLTYQLRAHTLQLQIEAAKTGISESGLNMTRERFLALRLTVPPIKEQKRIAQTLDVILAQVDTLKARIDAIPVLLKRFRQAVRVVALAGELERGKLIDSAKWKSCILSDMALVETGKTPDRSEPKYWTNGSIAWVTSAATGASTCEEAKEFVTHQAAKECNLKIFAPETLLLAMYGEGKTRGQVTELRIHAACNQACAAISVDKNLAELGFVKLRLEENYQEIRKMAAGGAQPNLNLGKVREIPISLPPKEMQADIVRRVDQLFTFAGQLEAQALAAKKRIDALTQSILAKAFRGELVPQDPNDEPASVLLERIRAQRAAAPKPKRGRKASSN